MNAIGYAILVYVVSILVFGIEVGEDGSIFKFNMPPGTKSLISALLALATLLIMWGKCI